MKARTLLLGSALFTTTAALADEPIAPPVDVCTVNTNTKGGPIEVPCPEPEEEEEDSAEPADTAAPSPR